jgi:hypothetical protein
MTEVPETQYTRSADGTNLAYQVSGDGPLDLVFVSAARVQAKGGSVMRERIEDPWLCTFNRLVIHTWRGGRGGARWVRRRKGGSMALSIGVLVEPL